MFDLNFTQHVGRRMNQRGITKDMIELVLQYGDLYGDKVVTNRKNIQRLLKDVDQEIKALNMLRKRALKIMDKGGVTVINANGNIITAYNS